MIRDLWYALRSLRRTPALVGVAMLSLAVGIGLSTTLFAAIDPLAFKPYDLPAGDRLINIYSYIPKQGGNTGASSIPDLLDWRERVRSVEQLGGYELTGYNWNGLPPERLRGVRVTGGFLQLHGFAALIGREISQADESEAAPVAMVSERLWRRRFAADPGVLGQRMLLDGDPYVIVGVVPTEPRLPLFTVDVWTSVRRQGAFDRGARSLGVVGRLRPGSNAIAAQTEIRDIAKELAATYPLTNRGYDALVMTYRDTFVPSATKRLAVTLLVSIGFVLLIACMNVANLLLARGTVRARELAIRTAIGASRGRITRELLVESAMLAFVGGALGVALSFAGVAWLGALLGGPVSLPALQDLHLSGRVLGFTVGITVAAGLIFGVVPSFRAASPNFNQLIRDGNRGGTGSHSSKLRNALVITELAMALVLLVSAGLLIRTSLRLRGLDLGIEPRGAYSFSMALSGVEHRDTTRRLGVQAQLEDQIRALPGVEAVGAASDRPLEGRYGGTISVVGKTGADSSAVTAPVFFDITPGYLGAVGARLTRGRNFAATDQLGAPPVVLINEQLARRYWPSESPLGHQIRSGGHDWEIVGVVADVRVGGFEAAQPDLVFFPAWQTAPAATTYVVRSGLALEPLADRIRGVVASLAPGQPIQDFEPLERYAAIAVRSYNIMTQMLVVLGGAALALSMIGVYGVLSYSVTQRRQELGIRRALGAQTVSILQLLLTQTGIMVGIGSVLGAALAAAMSRLIASVFVSVQSFDLAVFIGVPVLLSAAAVAATLVPARRAVKIDAMVTLKGDPSG